MLSCCYARFECEVSDVLVLLKGQAVSFSEGLEAV